MVIFILKVLSALIFYVMPVFEESVNALVPSNGTDGVRKGFDFRDIVRENSKYSPFVDLCPLRIYGGRAVDIKEIPYQVVIRKGVRRGQVWVLICGGSIITNIYVLTAAHCFERKALRTLRLYRVVAGASKSNWFYSQSQQREEIKDKLHSDDEVWRKIVNCFKHAYYNPRYINHDMAVLLLESPVRYSQNIQPIPMLKYTHNIPLEENGLCLVSGYGLMEHRNPSPLLRMVCVPLVTTARCRRYYGRKSITNYQFCAGDSGMDSCQGDSGGPLTYKGYLVGIVSYGGACGEAPGVYTLVTAYTTGAKIPFIRGHCAILSNTHGILILVFLTFVWNFIVTSDL